MNILLITDAYVPNANSSAVLMRDLAFELKKYGNIIYVLTIEENNLSIKNAKTTIVEEHGIKILRVKGLKRKNVNFMQRGISEVLLPHLMYIKAMKYLNDIQFNLIITYSPPITFADIIKKIKEKTGCATYLILRDIFPQCAKDAGVLTNELLFNYFRKMEKKLYEISDYIGVQSNENLKLIVKENNSNKNEVELLYNWIDIDVFKNSIIKDFRKDYNIVDKIICLYAGNIGKYQELDFLLELSKRNIEKKDVVFLIVGSGSEKNFLLNKYGNLPNVIFKEFINPTYYPGLVKQCDIGLINLNRNLTIQNIPGKLLGYWAANMPVLAAVNKGNDIKEMIEKANGGFCCITGDMENYIDDFNKLYEDKALRKSLGHNGSTYLNKNYTSKIAANTILKHFENK